MLPNTKLPITINIDGLPLHKSGRTSFWPILANIHTMPHLMPMIVAIFCGPKKPESLEQYLRPLVNELNGLIDNGIMLGCPLTKVCIKVRAFVADSPARSFHLFIIFLGVVSHTRKHGCLKCTVVGYHHPRSRTTCFPGTNAPLRTDKDFRNDVCRFLRPTPSRGLYF